MCQYVLYVVLLLIGVAIGALAAVLVVLTMAGDLRSRRVTYLDGMPSLLTQEPWCRLAEEP